jgi:hypothetical protein
MPQREQVDAGLDAKPRMGAEQRRGLDQPVHAVAAGEGHVVADRYAVDARGGDA